MGRPKSVSDKELLAAAARVIGRRGPVEFTIRQVAEEAGLSAAAVMQRFGTKRGLVLALERQARADAGESFDAASRAHASRLDAIVAALSASAKGLGPAREMANHIAFLAIDLGDDELHALTLALFDEQRRRVRALLDEAVAAGELPPGVDADGVARMVEVAYHGALVAWAVRRQGPASEAVAWAVRRAMGPAARPP